MKRIESAHTSHIRCYKYKKLISPVWILLIFIKCWVFHLIYLRNMFFFIDRMTSIMIRKDVCALLLEDYHRSRLCPNCDQNYRPYPHFCPLLIGLPFEVLVAIRTLRYLESGIDLVFFVFLCTKIAWRKTRKEAFVFIRIFNLLYGFFALLNIWRLVSIFFI